MFIIKVFLLFCLWMKYTHALDKIFKINSFNCRKSTVTTELLTSGNITLSQILSDPKINRCSFIKNVTITGISTNNDITLNINKATFVNGSVMWLDNIQKVNFINKSLVGTVIIEFKNCVYISFEDAAFEDATFVQIHLYDSNLVTNSAFKRFHKFIVVDHNVESSVTRYDWIANESSTSVIIAGNSTTTYMLSKLYEQYQEKSKCVGIYLSIPVFCILVMTLAILGICLIWTKWAWDSEHKLLRWYVANTVDEEEFLEEHVLLRNSNILKRPSYA